MTLTLTDMRLTRQVQKYVYNIWINVNHSRCNYMQLLTGTWFMILSSLVPSHFSCKTVSMKNPMCSCVTILVVSCATVASRWLKMTQKLQPEYASAAVRWNCSILVTAMQTRYILHLTIPTRRAYLYCTAQTEEMQLDLWISDCAFPCHQFLKLQIFKGLPSWIVLNLRGS